MQRGFRIMKVLKFNWNKKAGTSLLKFVMWMVIGVICVLLAVGFVVLIISWMNSESGLAKAKENFEILYEKVLVFEESDKESDRVEIYPPKKWYLKSYKEYEDVGGGLYHQECLGFANCLCLCKKRDCSGNYKVCNGVDFELEVVGSVVHVSWGDSFLGIDGDEYYRTSEFDTTLVVLKLLKQDNKILIEVEEDG